MTGFSRQQGTLTCDGVPLSTIASAAGTPFTFTAPRHSRALPRDRRRVRRSYPHALHYALKANSTLAIARLLRWLGAGADANSGGEIDVALRAGFIPDQIVFTGVGKTEAELAQAIDLGRAGINAESAGEVERIDRSPASAACRTRIALRVNPDIDARSHPHISTGLKTNKFGMPIDAARELCRRFAQRPGSRSSVLHMHVGSQITSSSRCARGRGGRRAGAGAAARPDPHRAHRSRRRPRHLLRRSPGRRRPSTPPRCSRRPGLGLTSLLEPGAIVGPAGVLLSRVVDVKPQPGGNCSSSSTPA